jgi:hypothetical protein
LYGYVQNPNAWVDRFGLSETCPVTNSNGDEVTRTLVNDEDELLAFAEEAAGGSLDGWSEYKDNWYTNEDNSRHIEINFEGHKSTDEGPHVTVRDHNGERYACTDKAFIKGNEKYKKDYDWQNEGD